MNKAMMDMPTLMSKFLSLGMPLTEVIRASSANPASQIGHNELGQLSVGAIADIAVLHLDTGSFRYRDAQGGAVEATQRLSAELTLKSGRVMWDWNSRAAADYKTLDPRYGARDVEKLLTPPE